MGDVTFYSLVIAEAGTVDRPVLAQAAAAFLQQPIEVPELSSWATLRPDGAMIIEIEQRRVGECRQAAEDVLAALTQCGVEVAFAVCEDPRYEWLGTLCRYVAGHGIHEVDCGPAGEPVIDIGTVRALARQHPDPGELVEAIGAHLGAHLPWLVQMEPTQVMDAD